MLFGWGANSYGQLGLGTFTEQETEPTPISTENSFTKITGIRLELIEIAIPSVRLCLVKVGRSFSCRDISRGMWRL